MTERDDAAEDLAAEVRYRVLFDPEYRARAYRAADLALLTLAAEDLPIGVANRRQLRLAALWIAGVALAVDDLDATPTVERPEWLAVLDAALPLQTPPDLIEREGP